MKAKWIKQVLKNGKIDVIVKLTYDNAPAPQELKNLMDHIEEICNKKMYITPECANRIRELQKYEYKPGKISYMNPKDWGW